MDVQQLQLGFSISFSCLFIAGFAGWGIGAISNFFKMMSGG